MPKNTRNRVYAFIFYPESAPENWREILDDFHVCALVSPLHDKDINPDGTPKKPHYHIMLLFEGVKTEAQVRELIKELNAAPKFEIVQSTRGYARYLLHKDNPEKYQYDRSEIIELGGADYESIIHLATDDNAMLSDIVTFLIKHKVTNFILFWEWCKRGNPDWFNLIATRHSRVVYEAIKSNAYALEHPESISNPEWNTFAYLDRYQPETEESLNDELDKVLNLGESNNESNS